MSDTIDRQAAIDAIQKDRETGWEDSEDDIVYRNACDDGYAYSIQIIRELPSAKRKKGKWIWDVNGMDWGLGAWCCSECGIKAETWWADDKRCNPLKCSGGSFCGNCGADMRGE